MIQEREYRLLQLGYIAGLPYEEKMHALKLIQRGADASLLYFWFNVTHGNYKHLPDVVLYKDAHRMIRQFSAFRDDIQAWVNPIISKHFQITLDYGYKVA
jgi:hypothetical protein